MNRVVIDTNVIISAIVFGGLPQEVLNLAVTGKIQNYISDAILDEVKDVLKRPKFDFDTGIIRAIVRELEAISIYVDEISIDKKILRDRDDAFILACAVSAGADYLITGDDDLLSLGQYTNVKIVSPADFLKII